MTLLELLDNVLADKGYGGLACNGECACKIGDLSPGGCLNDDCDPVYVRTHSITGDWIVSIDKQPLSDEQIEDILDDI